MEKSVKDIMTTQVVAVKRGATFKEMAARLRQDRVSAFPVVDDDGKVIGVVSEADMLAKEVRMDDHLGVLTATPHHREQEKSGALTAGELMTHPAFTVTPGDSVEHAARLMYTLQVKRLPVVTPDGRLAGIISRTDVLAVFDRPDEEIRREIVGHVIACEFLDDPDLFTVTVQAGVVTVEGNPKTASLGRELVRTIRHVPGVVAVRDRFSYPGTYAVAVAADDTGDAGTRVPPPDTRRRMPFPAPRQPGSWPATGYPSLPIPQTAPKWSAG